jgi:hypothetical protein
MSRPVRPGGHSGIGDSRHHRRRRYGRYTPPKLRGAAWLTIDECAERLDECACPAMFKPGTELGTVVVVHLHDHGCPALRRWGR